MIAHPVVDLTIERPVAGGRMLARLEGGVAFVAGGIPGERVRARVERRQKQMLWARVVEVIEASPDRRTARCDLECGGSAFAHIAYERQRRLKAEIVADAFGRIGKLRLDAPVPIAPSPEEGYRLRARLQIRESRVGFFREGSHVLCDAAATGQLLGATTDAVEAVHRLAPELFAQSMALVVSENVAASERVLHFESAPIDHAHAPRAAEGVDRLEVPAIPAPWAEVPGITGVTWARPNEPFRLLFGESAVADDAVALFGADAPVPEGTRWQRRPTSFFQGNRYLLGALVRRVLGAASADRVIDLYSGVGLFAVAIAAAGGGHVTAVEGEVASGADLDENAAPYAPRLVVVHASVEDALARGRLGTPDVVVMDPPRTGASAMALDRVVAIGAARIVYVSCDPPTLARDAAKLVAAGYHLATLDGFDLFPNTAHVECVAMFDR